MHLRGKQFWSFKLNHIYLLYKICQCIEINNNWFSGAKANTGITLWCWGISFSFFLFLSVKKLSPRRYNHWLAPLPPPPPHIKLWRVGEFHQYLYSLGNHGALDHFLPVTCQIMTATTSLFSKLGKRKLLSLHLVVTNIYITRQQFSDWLHLITVILQTDIRDKGHKSMLSGSP